MDQAGYLPEWPQISSMFRGYNHFNRFELKRLKENEKIEEGRDSYYRLLFLVRGKATLRMLKEKSRIISENECVLLPTGTTGNLYPTGNGILIILLFDAIPEVCERKYQSFLYPYLSSYEFRGTGVTVPPVIMNSLLSILRYMDDDILTAELSSIKQQEIFVLLLHYMHPKDLISLFCPLLKKKLSFKELILAHYQKAHSAKDLLQISGLKRTSFDKKFRENFGTSAHQWLLKQRALLVCRKLKDDKTLSIEQVGKMCGFNSSTHFVRFCRQQFNCTPKELRRHVELMK
ncbi:MAG: AraC family transcriptional regulator [Tannerellaceae bacterium]|nr:AraC family transcriptional regulator [Tannerellaceae bacterium]